MNRFMLIIILASFWACEEDMDITEFEDEFGEYRSELRIEAILDPVNPENSIVRIDQTILVTDTSIFNGRDDDGDWNPLTDDIGGDGMIGGTDGGPPKDDGEGNGIPDQGEPHVDEYDEILPQIHDTSAIVTLVELGTVGGPVIDFVWEADADSFEVMANVVEPGFVSPGELEWEYVTYGGYRPLAGDYSIDYEKEYEFQISSGDRLIKGPVKPLRPPSFIVDEPGDSLDADTLRIVLSDSSLFLWTMETDAFVCWVVVEIVLGPDSLSLVTSHPAGTWGEDDRSTGGDLLSLYFPGLYRWIVTVPSQAYGAYFYSDLPMRDKELSNLRDDDKQVVLGIAGSAATSVQYVRIVEASDTQ
ncbi:MAG: hypothetical protein V3W14_13110 [Candidatus Neomarinimicrobiota bacterium]